MKKRFRKLKMPLLFRNLDQITDMFFTLCILHNMLLKYDGYEQRWYDGVFAPDDERR